MLFVLEGSVDYQRRKVNPSLPINPSMYIGVLPVRYTSAMIDQNLFELNKPIFDFFKENSMNCNICILRLLERPRV